MILFVVEFLYKRCLFFPLMQTCKISWRFVSWWVLVIWYNLIFYLMGKIMRRKPKFWQWPCSVYTQNRSEDKSKNKRFGKEPGSTIMFGKTNNVVTNECSLCVKMLEVQKVNWKWNGKDCARILEMCEREASWVGVNRPKNLILFMLA